MVLCISFYSILDMKLCGWIKMFTGTNFCIWFRPLSPWAPVVSNVTGWASFEFWHGLEYFSVPQCPDPSSGPVGIGGSFSKAEVDAAWSWRPCPIWYWAQNAWSNATALHTPSRGGGWPKGLLYYPLHLFIFLLRIHLSGWWVMMRRKLSHSAWSSQAVCRSS